MENYKKIIFRVMCDNNKHLEDTLKWYNEVYGINIKIINIIYDEVNFVDLELEQFTLTDIFNIGYHFGMKIQKLREKGEIDW